MAYPWSNKHVLVTGAGGFIGSHLVEALAAQGAQVRAFVRYNSRGDPGLLRLLKPETFSKIYVIAGDLRDPQAVRNAVEGCQVVLHLGALISIPYSYFHPLEVAETNFMGTLNILMACRDLGVERLIHTSTSEVYGTARQVPITEAHPLQGQSPYSASKIGADKMVESFYCTYSLPVVTVRPFNTYGPRQSARAVIPTIITQALTQNKIHLGNLDTTRDFTFVDDTVAGFIKAAEAADVEGQVFNLGVGQDIRVGDLVDKIVQKIGLPVEVVVTPERLRPEKSEVLRLVSDNRLAREVLGWFPQVDLDQGLDRTIKWISTNIEHYQPGRYQF
ncbi:MAG: SDR family NAD(P)-dependent oxidoreductase [Anaerolineales bacterium]